MTIIAISCIILVLGFSATFMLIVAREMLRNLAHANQHLANIGDGQLDPTNLIEQSFNLANQVEPKLKAFVCRRTLEDLKKNLKPGPLSGIPIGIKDIIIIDAKKNPKKFAW